MLQWLNIVSPSEDGDGKGEPVLTYKKPNVGGTYPVETPQESDEFNDHRMGLQWQWQANPQPYWAFPGDGYLRLFSYQVPDSAKNMWFVPNLLMQKFPADEFMATTKLNFKPNPKLNGEKTGLVIMGRNYAQMSIKSKKDGLYLIYGVCQNADKGKAENEKEIARLKSGLVYFRVKVAAGAKCQFSYSEDGINFTNVGDEFQATAGQWIGAKMGLFAIRDTQTNDSGIAEYDWFRVQPLK